MIQYTKAMQQAAGIGRNLQPRSHIIHDGGLFDHADTPACLRQSQSRTQAARASTSNDSMTRGFSHDLGPKEGPDHKWRACQVSLWS
jgi:hypothetical protein